MNVRELYNRLNELYPEEHRSSFDFDGLQICADEAREVRRIVTALDVTRQSVQTAVKRHADTLITHHPIFFSGTRTLDPLSSMDADLATQLMRHSINLITLHTRFDAGVGGINDTLCEKLGLTDVVPFGLPDEPIPLGRIGRLPEPMAPFEFTCEVTEALDNYTLMTYGHFMIERVLVVGGAAGDYLPAFLQSDADALVTGELSHHRRLQIFHAKKTAVEASHYGSEVIFCEAIGKVLSRIDENLKVMAFPETPHEQCVVAKFYKKM